ncbi:MAG: HepT-like ribonuclease domain-containing protein [Actinomycetota bacterium]
MSRAVFGDDEKTQLAVARALEIMGEAASRLSEDERALYPQIPWQRIVGMRTFLAHEYFRVDLDTVWNVVTNQLPSLIEQLRAVVPPEEL